MDRVHQVKDNRLPIANNVFDGERFIQAKHQPQPVLRHARRPEEEGAKVDPSNQTVNGRIDTQLAPVVALFISVTEKEAVAAAIPVHIHHRIEILAPLHLLCSGVCLYR